MAATVTPQLQQQQQQFLTQNVTISNSLQKQDINLAKISTNITNEVSSIKNIEKLENETQDNQLKTNYINGRLKSEKIINYETYYSHNEQQPQHVHPLVQYLDETELKYKNDNLFLNTPYGFPTKTNLLKEKAYRLPIIKDTLAEKSRYKRKLEEKQKNITLSRKKFDFKTADGFSSHYFLTGGRFNRTDTVDTNILNKYGIFVNRNNPELVYFKSKKSHPNEIFNQMIGIGDENSEEKIRSKSKSFYNSNDYENNNDENHANNYFNNNAKVQSFKNKSVQVPQLTKEMEMTEKRFSASLNFL